MLHGFSWEKFTTCSASYQQVPNAVDLGDTERGCRRASLKGFEQAFEAQLASVNITSAIQRVNDTRVTIHVPSFPDYQLPVSRVELINTKWIPRTSIISEQDIATVMGLHTVFVVARAIAAHGTLFHRQPRFLRCLGSRTATQQGLVTRCGAGRTTRCASTDTLCRWNSR